MISKKVILAADVLVSFVDRSSPRHLHASAFFRYFAQEKYYLYVTPLVISDAYTLIASRISPILARDFIKAISLSNIVTLLPDESDIKKSYKALLSTDKQDVSYDEMLLAVMAEKRGITQICTFSYVHPLSRLSAFYLPV